MNLTLVICPLQIELKALMKGLEYQENSFVEKPVDHLKIFVNNKFILSLGGVGKTQFAVQTQYLLDRIDAINRVICAGAAGALSDKLRPRDVVAATKTIEHDFYNKFVKKPPPEFSGDAILLKNLATKKFDNFNLHLAPIASGDEDVVDRKRAKELQDKTGAFAVAWEGAGGARACRLNEVPYLELRVITDMANTNSFQDFKKNLGEAMKNTAQVLLQIE